MIRVLVVDDSPLARKLIGEMLSSDPEIEVIGTAMNGVFGLRKAYREAPDVVTLDFEMPQMDGLQVLEALMARHPVPVVMISSFTRSGVELTMKALELGAVDFVAKPDGRESSVLGSLRDELVEKVKAAARASVKMAPAAPEAARAERPRVTPVPRVRVASRMSIERFTPAVGHPAIARPVTGDVRLIAVGASTGGVPGVEHILASLPEDAPPVLVVQHMPLTFTASFAARLDSRSRVHVVEAQGGEVLARGLALVARGDSHLGVRNVDGHLVAEVSDGEKVSGHRPSVDYLFHQCAVHAGRHCLGVILTGMGRDGAEGLRAIRDAGGRTIAESEETAVIYGMPGEAVKLGAAEDILRTDDIPARINTLIASGAKTEP